jgi:hypothetical protein
MIFNLCDGDITKKKYIEDNLDIADGMNWFMLKKYQNFIEWKQQKMMEKK